MRGYGSSNGAITVLNAFATGIGAAIGVDLSVDVVVHPSSEMCVECLLFGKKMSIDTLLIDSIIGFFRENYKLDSELHIRIDSNIPPEVGLKSSSAVSNALIMAIFDLLGYDYYYYDILRINTSVSRKCGVSVTGALDDAAASLLGGLVVTDNRRDIILRRYTIDKYDVLLAYPEYGVKTSRYIDRDFTFIGGVLSMVTDMLYDGNWREAMTLNGIIYSSLLGYDVKPIYIALEAGAEAASLSGKGPSYAAVSSDVSSIEDVWSRSLDYKFIRTVVW